MIAVAAVEIAARDRHMSLSTSPLRGLRESGIF
jgi:hypothetical protein